jgi:Uma2 family endonuclease
MAPTSVVSTPASAFVPIEQYLQTNYDPDLEYVDGELRERPVVQTIHGTMQSLLSFWFYQHAAEWDIRCAVEARIRVSAMRVRLPDVVVDRKGFWPQTLVKPPLLVIEVLSPDDRYAEMHAKIRDYLAMGIKTVWVIDPETRTAEVYGDHPQTGVTRLTVSGSPVYVDLAHMFALVDEEQASGGPQAN